MAGVTAVANAIRSDVYTELQTLGIDGDAIWENVGGAPPAIGSGTFFRVIVDFTTSPHVTPAYTRWDGSVIVECYDDLNYGPERVEALAESIMARLRRRTLSGLYTYRRAEFFRVGVNEDLGRWQGNARVEFTRFEAI